MDLNFVGYNDDENWEILTYFGHNVIINFVARVFCCIILTIKYPWWQEYELQCAQSFYTLLYYLHKVSSIDWLNGVWDIANTFHTFQVSNFPGFQLSSFPGFRNYRQPRAYGAHHLTCSCRIAQGMSCPLKYAHNKITDDYYTSFYRTIAV
jgi:hypothetical protein